MFKRIKDRIMHPPPLYKKVGGINAVVHRADGKVENLKSISASYAKRWGVGAGSGAEDDERAAELRAEVENDG
jgi:hypothetical protein